MMIKLLSPQTISPQDPFLNPGHCFQKASLYDHQLTCHGQASHDNQYATHYTIGAAHYTSRLLNINSLSRDNAGSFPPRVSSLPGTAWALRCEGSLTEHFSHTAVPLCLCLAFHSAAHQPLPLFIQLTNLD